jgi:hypothetical protein
MQSSSTSIYKLWPQICVNVSSNMLEESSLFRQNLPRGERRLKHSQSPTLQMVLFSASERGVKPILPVRRLPAPPVVK